MEFGMSSVKNKSGVDFSYTEELENGIREHHSIELRDFIPKIYGTTFNVRYVSADPLVFKIVTNDARDPAIYFGERTYPIFRLELYGDYHGEEGIVELFRQLSIKVE